VELKSEFTESTVVSSEPLSGEAGPTMVTRLRAQVAKFDVNAQEVRVGIKMLAAIVVKDAESREAAFQMVKAANKSNILIEATRKAIVKPWNDLVKSINDHAATFLSGPLKKAIEEADYKILVWDRAEAARKQEENRKLEAERLRLEKEEAAKQEKIRLAAEAQKTAVVSSGDFAARQAAINAMPPGIMRIKAQRELDAAKNSAVSAVEEQAAKASTEVAIDTAIAKSDAKDKIEENQEAAKGARQVTRWEVVDESLVHRDFLEVSEKKVNSAIKAGARAMPGIRIWSEDKLRH
jgi:hypothetical protein